ncbi:hypothetical protein KKG81_14085 [bacterium]|nr:hypothetical protein [bacterium]
MIDNIYLSHNAQFYKKKNPNNRIPDRVIENIIKEASKNKLSKSYVLNDFREERVFDDLNFIYSFRVYKAKKKVDFLEDEKFFDTVHAFILLIEYENNLIILKKSTNTITSSLSESFELMKYKEILNIVDDQTEIQRVSLRNMTISGEAIHSHSYETPGNLNGLLSMHSAGKSIPSNMRVKKNSTSKSLTASTGRVIESSRRKTIDNLFIWSKKQLDIMTSSVTSDFLKKFAQPIALSDVLPISKPKAILIEAHTIKDQLEVNQIEFIICKDYNCLKYKKIPSSIIDKIFDLLENVYEFENLDIFDEISGENIGKLKINEKSLSFNVPLLQRIKIKENSKIISLQKYIIDNKLYSIVFDNFKYMYFMGTCFEDNSGKSEIDIILEVLKPQIRFNTVISEKGTISSTHTSFDTFSMFGAVEDIHFLDDYIFCDDLGNEWCDHISINLTNKKINFIHSKADLATSLSASKMHEVIGQGIKNLGNMFFTLNDFKLHKEIKFNEYYKRDSTQSQIKRSRKGNLTATDFDNINQVINNYETHRECILSCSFLSKNDIEIEFNKIKADTPVKGNIYQLFWIISSFIHACRGSNIIPKIYCKP